MSLPPLPNRTILTPAKHTVWGYTLEQIQTDRKQVWKAALEEAATLCEKEGHVWSGAAASAFFNTAEKIRSLKK